ncbi:hypothetical protein LINGRAHAP2_LOCUS1921 [Linum grandiflorum]
MLLNFLSAGEPPAELRLRLQHVWRLCNPAEPDKYFALGTAWTDSEGTRIQGDSVRAFAPYLEQHLLVGSVYGITGFKLQPPRPSYRSCKFPQWLGLGPAANFELLPPEDAIAFKPESYEFVPFAEFPGRLPPCAYLTDFLGKVIGIGKPNHVPRGSGVAPVQTVIVIDARFALCYIGKTTASSSLASRVLPNLCHPAAETLRLHFTGQERSIKYIVPKFDTPEKLKKHMQDSYRTIRELNDMYVAGGDSDTCYRCSAEIVGFQQQQPWFYRACPDCSTAVVSHGTNFWCKNHDIVLSAAVTYRYRLKFNVSDATSATTFVLLGYTADRIMPISASELALAYPADYGPLPPTLQLMVGQKLIFGVHLPRQRPANPYEDFRISRIWGLNMPRAQILAQLPPPPVPYRTPSPPSRHETPLPPDPAYVPPVPTYIAAPTPPPPDPDDTLPLPRTETPVVAAGSRKIKSKSTASGRQSKPSLTKKRSSARVSAPKTPAPRHSRPTSSIAPLSMPAPENAQLGLASLEPPFDDDMPLSTLRSRKRPVQHSELLNTPPTPTATETLHQPSSNPLLVHFNSAVPNLQHFNASIDDLDFGENDYTCSIRGMSLKCMTVMKFVQSILSG